MLSTECELSGPEPVDSASDLAMVYKIVEIFHSVQGEGAHAGIPHAVSYTHLTLPTTD